MSVSHLQLAKSETRQLAERELRQLSPSWRSQPTDWTTSNGAFVVALVAIAALLAVLAIVLRAT
ncbi:MAG: hypothetical protein JNL83_16900 [Myxococcales bacterium]|nr:hypothetical protein [Myxococcales bacterium]